MSKAKVCPICKTKFVDKNRLITHIEKKHGDSIPEGWTPARYENYLRTGMTHGTCIVDKAPTDWNESTQKYHRLCNNPECKKIMRENAKKNMINKYGKVHLLDDPEMQRKMIYSKKNSGAYIMEDDSGKEWKIMYDSSYGKHFLEMLDNFLNFSPEDIMGPSPHTYEYIYEGKSHAYIPDFYIPSLNLEVEIKDGGDNPNKMPKIQQVDKVKEKLKDEVMYSLRKQVNYIKIVNKDYSGFFQLLSKLKAEDICYTSTWDRAIGMSQKQVKEYTIQDIQEEEILTEGRVERITRLTNTLVVNAKLLSQPTLNYNQLLRNIERQIKDATEEDISIVELNIEVMKDQFKKIINGDGEESTRLQYEARKALKYTEKKLEPMLQQKILLLERKSIKKEVN